MAGRKRCAGSEVPGPSKTSKRQVTKAAFEKWQQKYERIIKHGPGFVAISIEISAMCRPSTAPYAGSTRTACSPWPSRVFLRAWIVGSTNHKVSNVIDHATSEVHKVAMTHMRML